MDTATIYVYGGPLVINIEFCCLGSSDKPGCLQNTFENNLYPDFRFQVILEEPRKTQTSYRLPTPLPMHCTGNIFRFWLQKEV